MGCLSVTLAMSTTRDADLNIATRFSEDLTGPIPSSSAAHVPSELENVAFFYRDQIRAMEEFKLTTLYVDYGHLMDSKQILARAVSEQYYR